MAAVDVVMPAPPPPPQAPVVSISRRLALAAADTVVCLWIAGMWAFHASLALLATLWIGCLVLCGLQECTGATSYLVSLLVAAILSWPLSAVSITLFVELYTNHYQGEKQGAAIREAVIKTHLMATMVFAVLEACGFLLKLFAAKDSLAERIAYVIMFVPPLAMSVVCCLVSIPGFAVRVWKMRRHGSAAVVPI